jgi:hypothetical protein
VDDGAAAVCSNGARRRFRPLCARGADLSGPERGPGPARRRLWPSGAAAQGRDGVPARPARSRLLPGARRLDRDLRHGPGRVGECLHRAWRPPVHRRARPVQQPTDPGQRAHGRAEPCRARASCGLSPAGLRRTRHWRDRDARLHPPTRRAHHPCPGRGDADRTRPQRRHAPAIRTARSTPKPIRMRRASWSASSSPPTSFRW